jgi:hypothetical protein
MNRPLSEWSARGFVTLGVAVEFSFLGILTAGYILICLEWCSCEPSWKHRGGGSKISLEEV